ncbi:uncharacterized protein LOC113908237 isoform X1 [Zalophus californianus]|uniref:Uncharacterized protein LOC113908237 isoform X1 n=1 Tax=Zalophus californianus TaxID=9704 RepID=A0A6J2B200_ZALCA|nr:uncharacterized protein LOC113908237 isoform X1 [Zalophus californianus]XP_027424237.1 uncharacterized protein LOC113908237 isoform X1 [Zalophus californianus]
MPDPRFCAHCLALPSIPSELPLHITRAALSHRTSWLQEFSSSGPEFIGSFPIHPLSQPLEGSKEREGHAAELDEKKAGLHWPASGLGQVRAGGRHVDPTRHRGHWGGANTTHHQSPEALGSNAQPQDTGWPSQGRRADKRAGEPGREIPRKQMWSVSRGPKALPSPPSFPRTTAQVLLPESLRIWPCWAPGGLPPCKSNSPVSIMPSATCHLPPATNKIIKGQTPETTMSAAKSHSLGFRAGRTGFESNSITYWLTLGTDYSAPEHRCQEEGRSYPQVPMPPLVKVSSSSE